MIRTGFVMEQTLGHVTHHQNLAQRAAQDALIEPVWLPVRFDGADLWSRLPVVRNNWSLRGSLRARAALRGAGALDALFIHTQTLALFAMPYMRRIPTVISLDATPLNYDLVAGEYGDRAGNVEPLANRKYQWNKRTFLAARALITWCEWAKRSLVEDYQVPAERIAVIPPGVDMSRWNPVPISPHASALPRLLFVGGDFARKGGQELLTAFRERLVGRCELDIVTKDPAVPALVETLPGCRAHLGLNNTSAELTRLYSEADIFVFPTRGDCLPIAVMEAMAAGLPVITTNVGAIREEVQEGVNGLLSAVGDVPALAQAVETLLNNAALRIQFGAAARRIAETKFDLNHNYDAVLAVLKQCARHREQGAPTYA